MNNCAGFSTKEISVITHQSASSIYVRKTSIRISKIQGSDKMDCHSLFSSLLNALLRCVFCNQLFINDLSNAAAKAVFMVIREKAPTFASSENNKNKAL